MERAKQLAYGFLTCTGRATITSMLIAVGQQFKDWTAAYRLFWGERMSTNTLFEEVTKVSLEQLSPSQMIVIHMDDTVIRKTGKAIPGTGWKRDPLGPAFHTNLIWSQRFIQTSISLPGDCLHSQSRSIPIDFYHAPSVKKPGKRATVEDMQEFKEQRKKHNMSIVGLNRLKEIRRRINEYGAAEREIYLSVDGSYTNGTVLGSLPKKVTLIGRVRKDAKLYYLPDSEKTKGRNKVYGEQSPTPEEIRQDNTIDWQEVEGWAAGKKHSFKVKIVHSLRWRKTGKKQLFQLVVIKPLGYKKINGGELLYRQPAYLLCTDNELCIEQLLQAYLWRWEIEVNFREEKTINGCGQAQVRNEKASYKVPQFGVAVHALLHLAQYIYDKSNLKIALPKAKWEKQQTDTRLSTNNLLNTFRGYYWYQFENKSFCDFIQKQRELAKQINVSVSPLFSVFYQRN